MDRKSKVATKQRQPKFKIATEQHVNVKGLEIQGRHKTTSRSRDRKFKVDTKRQGQGIGNLR